MEKNFISLHHEVLELCFLDKGLDCLAHFYALGEELLLVHVQRSRLVLRALNEESVTHTVESKSKKIVR